MNLPFFSFQKLCIIKWVMMMDCNQLARAATKAGEILLESGAETYRVEDTMKRICFAYGAEVVDAYATPTMLLISFSIHGELCHNIKRTQIKSVDLSKIDKVNDLSRSILDSSMSLEEFCFRLEKINQERVYRNWIMVLGAAVCTLGFAFFFKGTLKDALCAAVIGMLLKLLMIQMDRIDFNSFFKYLIGGAFTTLCAIIASKLGVCHSIDTLIISVIMLLVPGLAITNAIRDTVSGDLVSGLARTAEALFVAVAIALGSGLVFTLLGGY